MVVVPAHPMRVANTVVLGFEARLLPTGQPALLAFTDLEKLVTALGRYQPWVTIDPDRLAEVAKAAGLPTALDPSVDNDAPRWTLEQLEALAADNAGTPESEDGARTNDREPRSAS
jgi:hypothetical protein